MKCKSALITYNETTTLIKRNDLMYACVSPSDAIVIDLYDTGCMRDSSRDSSICAMSNTPCHQSQLGKCLTRGTYIKRNLACVID